MIRRRQRRNIEQC